MSMNSLWRPVAGIFNLADDNDGEAINYSLPSYAQMKQSLQKILLAEPDYLLPETAVQSRTGDTAGNRPLLPFKYRLISVNELPPATLNKDKSITRTTSSSYLSPTNPDSLLFPDGLMDAKWVKKHQEIMPCAVLAFYTLPQSSGAAQQAEQLQQLDLKLVDLIKAQKKSCADLEIRFVAVLMLPHSTVDFQTDNRLSFIKKSAGFDMKPSGMLAFYTCSPRTELEEFVSGIEASCAEPAIAYYKEHIKRFKKKKAKVAATSSSRASFTQSSTSIGATGWNVRYDFKLGCFTEVIQDTDWATRYYINAYNSLMEIFKEIVHQRQKVILTNLYAIKPHSSRWIEMVALADTLSYKISRLLLSGESPGDAVFQVNRHINFFRSLSVDMKELSRSTAGFWEWLSCQYRNFGELVDRAVSVNGLTLPPAGLSASPASEINYLRSEIAISGIFGIESDAALSVSPVNGIVELHHAGFYYHMAAVCQRHHSHIARQSHALPDVIQNSEAIAVDCLTKSYEQYKKRSCARMTLYLASLIADHHMQQGKFDTAQKYL